MKRATVTGVEAFKSLPEKLLRQLNCGIKSGLKASARDLAMEARELLPLLIAHYHATEGVR